MEISKTPMSMAHGASKTTSKDGLARVLKSDGVKFTTTNGHHRFASSMETLTSKLLNTSPSMLNTTSSATLKPLLLLSAGKPSPTLFNSTMLPDITELQAPLHLKLTFFGTTS
jgi:hypothetical protein